MLMFNNTAASGLHNRSAPEGFMPWQVNCRYRDKLHLYTRADCNGLHSAVGLELQQLSDLA